VTDDAATDLTSDGAPELTDWLRANAARLTTLDPDCDDDADLEPLLPIVGDARVVALGESMHRIHEFYLIRHRIFRFLVRRAGFTALVLESGFPEGWAVDSWIRRGGPGLRPVLNGGVTYHFGKCQEMLDQVAWMRQHTLTAGRPLRFYGMDLPDSAASAKPAAMMALDMLAKADLSYAAAVHAHLTPLFGYLPVDRSGLAQAAVAIRAYLALPAEQKLEISARLNDLVERMRARRLDYIDTLVDAQLVAAAIRSAEVARSTDAFLSAMSAAPTRSWPPANIRDAAMADTVEWILRREPRILVAAANGHVQKLPYVVPPIVPQPMSTMGQHLADRLGDDLVVIGSAYGGGQAWLHRPGPDDPEGESTPFIEDLGASDPDSLDAALGRAGIGDYLVDLRRVGEQAAAALDRTTGTHNGPHVQPTDARRAFDAMVYVDRISPWHTWIDQDGHAD
jgi:erythromycin esterase-like protein